MLMNLQIGLATARLSDPDGTGPADYFRTATLGGAQALGRADLGRLEAGAAADIAAWDLSALDLQPVHDPIEALFLMPPGVRVRHLWVAGRRVVTDGKVDGIDETGLAAAMQAIFEQLRESYEERHQGGSPWQTLFPNAFPVRRKIEIQD